MPSNFYLVTIAVKSDCEDMFHSQTWDEFHNNLIQLKFNPKYFGKNYQEIEKHSTCI